MRKKVVYGLVALTALSFLIVLGVILGNAYGPTIKSYATLNLSPLTKERQEFLTTVYPLIPLQEVPGHGRIRIVNLDTYQEEAPYVEVRNCVPFPYMRLSRPGESIIFANSGGKKISLSVNAKLFSLSPWSRRSIDLNIPATPALYPIYCNSSPIPSGFIYAVNK